jgi:tetratricopeptide (TPR) repeat protein
MQTVAILRRLILAAAFAAGPAMAATPAAPKSEWLTRGGLLYAQKRYDEALAAYASSIRKDGPSAYAYQGAGNCYVGKGDRATALKYFRYSLQLNPNNATLKNYVAQLDGQMKAYSTAAAPAAGGDLAQGKAHYEAGRLDEALVSLNKAAAADPSRAATYQLLGNVYYQKKDKEQALANYRKALELNPANTALASFVKSMEQPAVAQGSTDWASPAWRSALLPGWGQYYNGDQGKAWTFGLATLGLLGATAATFVIGDAARQQYMTAGPNADFDTPYRNWETMATYNHFAFIGTVALYSYGIVDAIVSAKPGRQGTASLRETPLAVAAMPDGFKMKVRLIEF